jgi:methyl-accepting chemotaxis protein
MQWHIPGNIGTKLLMAFAAITLSTVIAGGVATVSFQRIEADQAEITERGLPTLDAARKLDGSAAGLAAALPSLVAATTPDAVDRSAQALGQWLGAIRAALQSLAPLDPAATDAATRLEAQLGEGVTTLATAARNGLAQAAARHETSQRGLAQHSVIATRLSQAADHGIAALDARTKDSISASGADITRLMTDEVGVLAAVLDLKAEVNRLIGLLTEAAFVTEARRLRPLEYAFQQSADRAQRLLTLLEPIANLDRALRLTRQLLAEGTSPENFFTRRAAALGQRQDASAAALVDLKRIQEDALEVLDGVRETAALTVSYGVEDTISAGNKRIEALIRTDVGQVRAYLELSAEINLIAGLIAAGDVATTPDHARALEARFLSAAHQITGLVSTLGQALDSVMIPAIETMLAAGTGPDGVFQQRHAELLARSQTDALANGVSDTAGHLVAQVGGIVGTARDAMRAASSRVSERITNSRTLLVLLGVSSLALTCFLYWYSVRRRIVGRLHLLTEAMQALSRGNLAALLPKSEGRDELDRMANALSVFRETAVALIEERAKADAARQAAADERRRATLAFANGFEAQMGTVVTSVQQTVARLEASAAAMDARSRQIHADAQEVVQSATRASHHVQEVASATEELSTATSVMAADVTASNRSAEEGVQAAQRSSQTMEALTNLTDRIGDIVGLISMIARRTNLLALNASIEAARAGDAGKGFAVVAQEVRVLASQTGEATEQVTTLIEAIQSASQSAVETLADVSGIVSALSGTATSIAAAIQEQDAATREIARSIAGAGHGTRQVAETIAHVGAAATIGSDMAARVFDDSRELTQVCGNLSHEIETFLASVRAG